MVTVLVCVYLIIGGVLSYAAGAYSGLSGKKESSLKKAVVGTAITVGWSVVCLVVFCLMISDKVEEKLWD